MRKAIPSCCAALLLAGLGCPAGGALVELEEGDFLRGELRSVDADQTVWRHVASGKDLRLPTSKVRRFLFSAELSAQPAGDVVLLRDGSLIAGRLDRLGTDEAVVHTGLAGDLVLSRSLLSAIKPSPEGSGFVYRGAGGFDVWKTTGGDKPVQWQADDGLIRFSGSQGETIQADFDLPPALEVSFDLAWDGRSGRLPQFGVRVGDPEGGNDGVTSYYALNFSRTTIFLQRSGLKDQERTHKNLGRVRTSSYIGNGNRLSVRLVLNRPKERAYLYLNGRKAGSWADTHSSPPTGGNIRLTGYPRSPIKIRNLQVRSWNGLLGGVLALKERAADDKDWVVRVDGDEIPGRILGVQGSPENGRRVIIKNPLAKEPFEIPLQRVRHLRIGLPDAGLPADEDPQADGAGVMVTTLDGSRLRGTLLGGDKEGVKLRFGGGNESRISHAALIEIKLIRPEASEDSPEDNGEGEGET